TFSPPADQAIVVRPRSLALIAPLIVTRLNVWPPSVDSKKPLHGEPSRQPTTASTTWPFVPGLTATSLTKAPPSPVPVGCGHVDCDASGPTPALITGVHGSLEGVDECL